MNETGYYYLHENGSLIYKRFGDPADFEESPFVRAYWPIDTSSRLSAWRIILEGLAQGASVERVRELAAKWGCDNKDFHLYLAEEKHKGEITDRRHIGATMFLKHLAGYPDPEVYWKWLSATPKGSEPDMATLPEGVVAHG